MQTNKSNGQLTAQINVDDHKKSGFDLSNNVLGTGKIGRIIPTRALHVMPNDTIKADSKVAVQFEPLAVPILANMDVKQEHFYVPYNIVWKNWDKFISGGEKMDYKGVVPNVSMRKIVHAVQQTFITSSGSLYFPFTFGLNEANNAIDVFFDIAKYDTTTYDNNVNVLNYIGDKYQIKDLLKPQYEALKQLRDFVNNFHDPTIKIFTNSSALHYSSLPEANKTKYFESIVPALIENDSNKFWMPIAENQSIIQLIYEVYKPLIGIGSNIDYLNMGRITFTDFLYSMCMELYKSTDLHDGIKDMEYMISSDSYSELPMSVLNLRANYNIWFNNYRDILLEADAMEPVDIDEITNDELFVLLVPRQRCWEKDAFTTALDNPGTGNVGVPTNGILLNGDANNIYDASSLNPYLLKKLNIFDGNSNGPTTLEITSTIQNNIAQLKIGDDSWDIPTAYLSGINSLFETPDTKATRVTGFSLYALDAAQRAQKWLQKALFFGNRISDFYYMHFGVRFLDARLRLPELLTSSSELVKLDVVMNNTNITTEANGEIYQSIAGDRAAYASAYDNGNSFERYCEEHGVIMSYLTIMPQVTYAYGMNRDYSRLDQFDFAFSEFATLGMDAVYDSEITAISVDLPNNGQDVKVFGYQGKYYDYKAKHSEEHGELLDSQDMYTFARKFNMYDPNGRPKLNYEFVHCFPDLDMFVVNSTLSDYFRYDIRHSTAAERNLPSQSIYI